MNTAVFLDRDGTLNQEVGYLGDPRKLKLLPGVSEGISIFNQLGLKVIVITNQSAVGRGYFPKEAVEDINRLIRVALKEKGACINTFYYCSHTPEEDCSCRKPRVGLYQQAAKSFSLQLEKCYNIGDSLRDMEAGSKVGCRNVLVLTGNGRQTLREIEEENLSLSEYVADNLYEAAVWIREKFKQENRLR